jgi:hypothetical protein
MAVPYHPPLHADVALAQRLERAEIEFCAVAASHETSAVASLDAGGGRALFSAPGSFLNKMLGLGVGAPVDEADLDAIAAFYAGHGEAARLELCPVGASDLPPRLAARGFGLHEFENELARRLPLSDDERRAMSSAPPGITVERVATRDEEVWVRAVADGFAVTAETLRAFLHPAIDRYLVRVDGEVAGGGTAYVHQGVLGIFGTSTLEAYRRRGVQTALAARALVDAGDRADVAMATTAPASTSQRTFERLGFGVMYTRAILVLPLQRPNHGLVRSA